jgi:hypothetical protein
VCKHRLTTAPSPQLSPYATPRDNRGRAIQLRHVAFARLWITPIIPSERPTLSFMSHDQMNGAFHIDANGCLTERVIVDGHDVIVHYDDVPESDVTSIDGIRCTTALRTVIDVAPELDRAELERMVRDCLDRRLFTREEAMQRVSKPDMLTRLGAKLVRQIVSRPGGAV